MVGCIYKGVKVIISLRVCSYKSMPQLFYEPRGPTCRSKVLKSVLLNFRGVCGIATPSLSSSSAGTAWSFRIYSITFADVSKKIHDS